MNAKKTCLVSQLFISMVGIVLMTYGVGTHVWGTKTLRYEEDPDLYMKLDVGLFEGCLEVGYENVTITSKTQKWSDVCKDFSESSGLLLIIQYLVPSGNDPGAYFDEDFVTYFGTPEGERSVCNDTMEVARGFITLAIILGDFAIIFTVLLLVEKKYNWAGYLALFDFFIFICSIIGISCLAFVLNEDKAKKAICYKGCDPGYSMEVYIGGSCCFFFATISACFVSMLSKPVNKLY